MSSHPEETPQHLAVEVVQDMVFTILRSVFGRNEIDPDAHFLDLGGSSIEALRVVDMVEREIDSVIPIALVFEAPTIRLLCASLAEFVVAQA